MSILNESIVEKAALAWLEGIGYTALNGLIIAPDEPAAERATFGDVVLLGRLREALLHINPQLPLETIDEAIRKVTRPDSPSLLQNNRAFHRMLVNGVPVEYRREDGSLTNDVVWLVDYAQPTRNNWLAINQLSIQENRHTRRPDIILFVNGLPLVVVELKNAADEQATIWHAYQKLQNYK